MYRGGKITEEAGPGVDKQSKKRKFKIAVMVLAFFTAITIVVYFVIFDPATSLLPSIHDNDGDGIADSQDFYDYGNGKIKVSITSYQGDESADLFSASDPYFAIYVYYPADSYYYYDYDQSAVFQDAEYLDNPFYAVFDIPDNATSISFVIKVYESDVGEPQMMDYNPSASVEFWVVQTVDAPFSGDWSNDGSEDGISSEVDCELSYSIQVVG
ncbi:MAG: hypothetical protein QHH00_05970 [Methanomassiliicoccales archaeon]|nr:hypothetical protein [Methanomassiliicoccales archaeon]